jgi:hypothetical protein
MPWNRDYGVPKSARKDNVVLIGLQLCLNVAVWRIREEPLTIFEVASAAPVSRVAKSGFDLTTFVT